MCQTVCVYVYGGKAALFSSSSFFQLQTDHRGWGTAGGKAHTSLCFSVIHHFVRVHFQTISTSITLFNPYHMLVGVSYGFCGIDEETEGLHDLPSVTGLIKGRPWVPVCPLSSMSLSTLPQLKWKERDAGPGTSPLVSMYQGQVPTLGRSLTPMGYVYKDTCGTSIFF